MAAKRTKSRLRQRLQEKWKHFERLVAAIHQAADRGSDVRWNEVIAGRQFDVTIRFRKGLYDHLTVVECKDYKQTVSVEKVEAFVTKSRDVHANVAVLASTSGFQSGAKECAKRHGITLLHVTRGSSVDLAVLGLRWGEPTDMLHIESICLQYADGTEKELPRESNVLTYYSHQTLLERAGTRTTVDAVITEKLNELPEDREYRVHTIAMEHRTSVVGPLDGEIPLKVLSAIQIRVALVEGKTITGPYKIDPVVLSPTVEVQNVGTNETTSFDYLSLPLGVGNFFVAGRFYEAAGLGFFHYCHSVNSDLAEVWLVESFQHGHLWQAKLVLEMKAAENYVEVTDEAVIERLERRRRKME
jgi:hypothetical protein